MKKKLRVAYFEGRPHGHPTHSLYAKSIGAVFYHFDLYLRYHDLKHNRIKMTFSWLLTTFLFPKKKYDVFFSQEPYPPIALIKSMRLVNKKKKIISLIATHTLFFMQANQYSNFTKKVLLYTFSKYDTIICIGEMQKEMLSKLLDKYKKKPNLKTISNGASEERFNKLLIVQPNLTSKNIFSIAETTNKDRCYYKGLDLNIKTFEVLIIEGGDYYYDIIGTVNDEIQKDLLKNIDPKAKERIHFLGRINNIENKISEYSLYIHLARGEAWGISINESLLAGIPTIVSEWTGSKELVYKISPKLIVPLSPEKAKAAILNYFSLDKNAKIKLSNKCKEISSLYTEKKAVEEFKKHFYDSI